MKICSYNINGIRSSSSKGLSQWITKTDCDIYCFQETRATAQQTQALLIEFCNNNMYFNPAQKKGYSGTAVLSKVCPKSVSFATPNITDDEGRIITLDYGEFVLFNLYTPNGGIPERLPFKMSFMNTFLEDIKQLINQGREVIICTDFNISHTPLDLTHPKECQNRTGYLPQERELFDEYLKAGLYDVFRELHPNEQRFTWSSYSAKKINNSAGWLYTFDYIFATKGILSKTKSCIIDLDANCSDHYPVVADIDM